MRLLRHTDVLAVGAIYSFTSTVRPGTGSLAQQGFVDAMAARNLDIRGTGILNGGGFFGNVATAIVHSGDIYVFSVVPSEERTQQDAAQMVQNAAYHVGVRAPAQQVSISLMEEGDLPTFGGFVSDTASTAGQSLTTALATPAGQAIQGAVGGVSSTLRFVSIAVVALAAIYFIGPVLRR